MGHKARRNVNCQYINLIITYPYIDDFVMVGTKEGHLLIYKITFTEEKSSPEIAIALSNKNFTFSIGTGGTRKPILQIGIIPEHKVLIALTTGRLAFVGT